MILKTLTSCVSFVFLFAVPENHPIIWGVKSNVIEEDRIFRKAK